MSDTIIPNGLLKRWTNQTSAHLADMPFDERGPPPQASDTNLTKHDIRGSPPRATQTTITDEKLFHEQILVHKVKKRAMETDKGEIFCPTWPRDWVAIYRNCITTLYDKVKATDPSLEDNPILKEFREHISMSCSGGRADFKFMHCVKDQHEVQRYILILHICGAIAMDLRLLKCLDSNYGGNLSVPINTSNRKNDFIEKATVVLVSIVRAIRAEPLVSESSVGHSSRRPSP